MKKFNLFAMGLLAAAAVSFTACSSNDDLSSNASQQQSVDGFYMTLQVKGSANGAGTRTEQQTNKEEGTAAESTISNGTIYIYNGPNLVFTKNITSADWKKEPTQTQQGTTKPIKVSVNSVNTTDTYHVYFLANNGTQAIADPINNDAAFTASTTGGANYALDKNFVMFNQNDKSKQAAHSTVKFTSDNLVETNPANADVIYLDRVVARIDAPTVNATKITKSSDETEAANQTKNIDLLSGVSYTSYAVSNLSNNAYVMQNWDVSDNTWTLNVPYNQQDPYYLPYTTYGNNYKADGLTNFKTNAEMAQTYAFENTTSSNIYATALYFCIKANLTDDAKTDADFNDGTFYRYDNRIYTKISDILADNDVAYPFVKVNDDKSTTQLPPAEVLAMIKDTDSKLIAEGETLSNFRNNYNIEVYREGNMYYRYAINDNYYQPDDMWSVLRNSIYKTTVSAIYDLGKDVPNGKDKDEKHPNYYMNVKVAINQWVLNTNSINLK